MADRDSWRGAITALGSLIGFSRQRVAKHQHWSIQIHDIVIGLFVNRYEFELLL